MGFQSRYENKYQTGGLQHLFASHIRCEVEEETFSRYYKFSIVRNPWDKAVSQFHYMQKREDLRDYIGMDKGGSFKKYLELTQKRVHVQWDKQHRFLVSDHGELMVDFVGRFENFNKDVRKVLSQLSLFALQIPHMHRSRRRPYQEYYDGESREFVASIYHTDIDLFGYSFEGEG